jgi:TorA maturation chaperone TorD
MDALRNVEELAEVLKGRSEFYMTLAVFYFKPLTQEQIDTMAQSDYSAFGAGEPLIEDGFNDIGRYLRKRHSGTRQQLAVDFTSSFGGAESYEEKRAVPYSSPHLSKEGLLNQESRLEAFLAYKKARLKADPGLSMPDDHLSFELEFLSVLSDRAAEALLEGDREAASDNLRASRDFIENHILAWFPIMAELANKLIETRFYRGVMKVTEGYLKLDLRTIDDLVAEIDG